MGIESRARGANYSAGVCVNLARHPAWGRAQESYGEDPLILGSMGTALTLGIRENAMACVKHFALNSMENMRFEVDVKVDEETLHEVYLPHFKQCLEEGGAESLMSSYNSVNGEYVGENKVLLHEMLREDWKMPDVLVTSDFVWGLRDGPKSIKAGLDIEMPWRAVRATSLAKALKRGDLTWEEVKRPGLRIMATQLTFCARMVGTPTPSVDTVGSDQHRALARRVATEGMTLLKNDNDKSGVPLLPLQRKIHKSIAVVGSLADSTQTGDQGSSAVRDNHIISPLAGFKQDHDISTTYMDGSNISNAVQAAESADAVFLLVGYTAKEEGESILCSNVEINRRVLPGWASTLGVHYILKVVGKAFGLFGIDTGGDRKSLRLRSNDEKLIEAIAIAAGHKTILGIEASGAVILPPEARRDCAAILWTGYQGCEFGNALQDVLWGRSEPSGRLPFVIPENEEDLPEWSPYCHLRPMVWVPTFAEEEEEGSVSFRIRAGLWRCADPTWDTTCSTAYLALLHRRGGRRESQSAGVKHRRTDIRWQDGCGGPIGERLRPRVDRIRENTRQPEREVDRESGLPSQPDRTSKLGYEALGTGSGTNYDLRISI